MYSLLPALPNKLLSFSFTCKVLTTTTYLMVIPLLYITFGNGTREFYPLIFLLDISRDLIRELIHTRVGCSIGGLCVNVLAYADDLVLCAPSWVGFQHLIDVLANHVNTICMFCSVIKTVCMVFSSKDKSKIVAQSFLAFCLGGNSLKFVSSFKYLGHILNTNSRNDSDID